MARLSDIRRIPRLLALFLVATILPSLALAWLRWRLIEQDRLLERQRAQDLVESTANGWRFNPKTNQITFERVRGPQLEMGKMDKFLPDPARGR